MGKSKIEWADSVWNPVTGCTKISPGCLNCYAEKMADRLQAMGTPGYENGFAVTLHPERLDEPLKWKKPRRIFVCSMGDLFHKDVPDEYIEKIFAFMEVKARRHTYIILTKRPERMSDFTSHPTVKRLPLYNVILGVTVESPGQAWRIPLLLQTPAAVRFLSCEPLLSNINLHLDGTCPKDWGYAYTSIGQHLHWVIVGAESGSHARPCKLSWVRSIRDQCQAANVPLFVKQLRIDGKLVKDINQFPEDLRIREYPE